MTDIASGRAMTLQKWIVDAIMRAKKNGVISFGAIREMFGDALKDPTIVQEVNNRIKATGAPAKYMIGVDPYNVEVTTASNLKDNEMMMLHPDGHAEVVVLEWDDVNKKNNVIVKKVK